MRPPSSNPTTSEQTANRMRNARVSALTHWAYLDDVNVDAMEQLESPYSDRLLLLLSAP
jgi:hypothetical protein